MHTACTTASTPDADPAAGLALEVRVAVAHPLGERGERRPSSARRAPGCPALGDLGLGEGLRAQQVPAQVAGPAGRPASRTRRAASSCRRPGRRARSAGCPGRRARPGRGSPPASGSRRRAAAPSRGLGPVHRRQVGRRPDHAARPPRTPARWVCRARSPRSASTSSMTASTSSAGPIQVVNTASYIARVPSVISLVQRGEQLAAVGDQVVRPVHPADRELGDVEGLVAQPGVGGGGRVEHGRRRRSRGRSCARQPGVADLVVDAARLADARSVGGSSEPTRPGARAVRLGRLLAVERLRRAPAARAATEPPTSPATTSSDATPPARRRPDRCGWRRRRRRSTAPTATSARSATGSHRPAAGVTARPSPDGASPAVRHAARRVPSPRSGRSPSRSCPASTSSSRSSSSSSSSSGIAGPRARRAAPAAGRAGRPGRRGRRTRASPSSSASRASRPATSATVDRRRGRRLVRRADRGRRGDRRPRRRPGSRPGWCPAPPAGAPGAGASRSIRIFSTPPCPSAKTNWRGVSSGRSSCRGRGDSVPSICS